MRSAAAVFLGLLLITFLSFTVVVIESGNVGVRKTLGKVNPEEVSPGLNFRVPAVTRITEFVGKEIAIDLTDLTPKAADNLSLRDMDVTVFYRAASGQIADLYVKYANAHQYDRESDSYFPAYRLVYREARRAAYETVAKIDSLTMHKKREEIGESIKTRLQQALEEKRRILVVGDFDADGGNDILWRNRITGATELWLMDESGVRESGATEIQHDSSWQVAGVGGGDALRQAAIAGTGLVLQPTFIVGKDIHDNRLQPVLDDYEVEQLAVYAVYPHRQYLSGKVRTFVDFLSGYFGSPPFWECS